MLEFECDPLRRIALEESNLDQEGDDAIAGEIDPSYIPVKAVEKFRINGNPLLFLDSENNRLILDQRYFGSFKIRDVANLKENKEVDIGCIGEEGLLNLGTIDWFCFVVEGRLLRFPEEETMQILLVSTETFLDKVVAKFRTDSSNPLFFNISLLKRDGALTIVKKRENEALSDETPGLFDRFLKR